MVKLSLSIIRYHLWGLRSIIFLINGDGPVELVGLRSLQSVSADVTVLFACDFVDSSHLLLTRLEVALLVLGDVGSPSLHLYKFTRGT